MRTTPKISVPPFYDVALVQLPEGAQEVPPRTPTAQPEKKTMKDRKAPKASGKGAMPELKGRKTAAREEFEEGEGKGHEAAAPDGQPAAVTVTTPQEFKFPPYLAIIRDKIERHWNPPPGVRDIKAKVTFLVLRSGQVGDANLEASSGNFYFDQAAMRAILTSSPFPPLPEGFFKESAMFSVDLMEKE